MDEHFATHVDSQCHFVTTDPELTIDQPDRRYAHEFTLGDLIGPLVYIDISERVDAELKKNSGQRNACVILVTMIDPAHHI